MEQTYMYLKTFLPFSFNDKKDDLDLLYILWSLFNIT